jgi:hypothetical protein
MEKYSRYRIPSSSCTDCCRRVAGKSVLIAAIACAVAASAERKPLPGQAGNDDIDLTASVLIEQDEIQQALGADLGEGYVVIRVKATPKTDHPLRIGPDDFTIISRKDGQRSQALSANQIAGSGATLVVKSNGSQGGGVGTHRPHFGLGGIGGIGNSGGVDKGVDSKIEQGGAGTKDNALLAALDGKVLPDKETKEPLEGYLYFPIDGKVKPKDLGLVYKGPAGKLIIEFQNPKGGR